MNFKTSLNHALIAILAVSALDAAAGSINPDVAKQTAKDFFMQKVATRSTSFKSPSMADIKLAYTQESSVEGNAYYVFNVEGGGWAIIAGDDRAKQVLAYSDKGNIDMNNMPGNMRNYLDLYKNQIEEMQSYKGEVITKRAVQRNIVIEPMLQSTWGQAEPMDRQCPMSNGERSAVGCGPLAMAQIMYYWKYPTEVNELPGYSASWSMYMPALPATTFDYSLMLPAYTIYNPTTGGVSLGTYTDEEAEEVAKLCRYCGQACKVRYSSSSGSYTYDQRDAFIAMGFNNTNVQLIGIDPSYYCDNNNKYTTEAWIDLIYSELEAGHPIPYDNSDFIDGHAWVLDGVDAEGKFHMNWGWYERYNGWFEFGAFTVYPNGEEWNFNGSGNEIIINVYPYDGYVIPGMAQTPRPSIIYTMTNNSVTFAAEGEGEIHMYIDGVEVECPYTIDFGNADVTVVVTATAQAEDLSVSKPAEMSFLIPSTPFKTGDVNNDNHVDISDLTALIDILLGDNSGVINLRADVDMKNSVNISDVTTLIDMLLNNNN